MICFRHKYYVKDAEERRIIGVIRISMLEYKIGKHFPTLLLLYQTFPCIQANIFKYTHKS